MYSLALKIRSCTKDLGSWNEVNMKELRAEISRKHEELRLATSMIQIGSWRHIQKIERELDVLLGQKKVYWR